MSTDFRSYKAAFLYQNDLAHHGIKGMKWGIRRYQNADGTLTPLGRKRYGSEENFNELMKAAGKGGIIGAIGAAKVKSKIKKQLKNNEVKKESEKKESEKKEETPKNSEEKIKSKLAEAKKNDRWSLDFLEAVQNEWFMTDEDPNRNQDSPGAREAMLKEYEKYLKDPEKYWTSR